MNNRLHEKLNYLRKYYNYSQADLARLLNVSVTEYMNYENGSEICGIQVLRALSKLYNVKLEELLDNTKDVHVLEEENLDESVKIPFIGSGRNKEIEPLDDLRDLQQEDIADYILPVGGVLPPAGDKTAATYVDVIKDKKEVLASGDTIDFNMHTKEFSKEDVDRVVVTKKLDTIDDDFEDDYEVIEEKPKKGLKALWIVLLLVIALIGGYAYKTGMFDKTIAIPSGVNRIALSDTFSIYVDDNGHLHVMGSDVPVIEAAKFAQVTTGNNFVVGLQQNGRVICSDYNLNKEVKNWKKIKMIASGNNHVVGLKEDGTLVCAGNVLGCNVSDWTDIKAVYAGSDITIGKKSDGSLLVSGNVGFKKELEGLKSINDVSISDELIGLSFYDGHALCLLKDGTGCIDVSKWEDVESIVVGSDFVAGLKDGGILCSSKDEEFNKTANQFESVRYIAGHDHTLVFVGNSGVILGVGNNAEGVYGSKTDISEEVDEKVDKMKLMQVEDCEFKVTAANVSIKFDPIPEASFYTIEVNTDPKIEIKSARNSASIPADKLVSKETYEVTIIANPKDTTRYVASSPFVKEFEYNAETLELEAPTNLKAIYTDAGFEVSWDLVDNAKSYHIVCAGVEKDTEDNKVLIEHSFLTYGDEYEIFVVAKPDEEDSKFTSSEPSTIKATYDESLKALPTISGVICTPTESGLTITWPRVDGALNYMVLINGVEPKTTYDGEVTFEGLPAGTYEITITANPIDSRTRPSIKVIEETYTPIALE